MDALAASLPGSAVKPDESLEREFEQRLADCPTLAYRVALGVLRNAAEAEDVAQDAMLRAYRNFHRLRDRERFRAWLVRTAWRLALDRWTKQTGRALTGTEEYALAKMRLFEAFDSVEDFSTARPELTVDETNVDELLARLDL